MILQGKALAKNPDDLSLIQHDRWRKPTLSRCLLISTPMLWHVHSHTYTDRQTDKNVNQAAEMAQWVKGSAADWRSKFNPQYLHSGRKEPTPLSCLLTSTYVPWTPICTHK